MKKIILLCANGMSTSIFVTKMRKEAQARNCNYEIHAFPVAEVLEVAKDADYVFLGPQVSYELQNVREKLNPIPVEVIDMMAYGMGDAASIIQILKDAIGEE